MSQFVRDCRLDGFGAVVAAVDTDDPEQVAIVEKMQRYAEPAGLNLFKLLSEA